MAKYEKFGNYTVFNPTPKVVKAGVGMMEPTGAEYIFKPYEEKVIYPIDHVHHITTSSKHLNKGLVFLDWNEDAKRQYNNNYDAFKRAKASEGLSRAIGQASLTVTYEQQAEKAAELGGFLIEKRSMNVEKHQAYLEKLETIQAGLEQPEQVIENEEEVELPEFMSGRKESVSTEEVEVQKPTTDKYGLLIGETKEINNHKVKRIRANNYMIDGKMVKTANMEALLESRSDEN